ncbi:hypothetical protein J1N35_005396 [Gossypium stocksii]|uniref:Uncharacterized protein n=1 Tax=Gossypium stocksii TaxID=47602 RepID=A0A9D3WE79_9ROSI|nr:hypothetical protein J1N35_005396 [Gossypium stocksii]
MTSFCCIQLTTFLVLHELIKALVLHIDPLYDMFEPGFGHFKPWRWPPTIQFLLVVTDRRSTNFGLKNEVCRGKVILCRAGGKVKGKGNGRVEVKATVQIGGLEEVKKAKE